MKALALLALLVGCGATAQAPAPRLTSTPATASDAAKELSWTADHDPRVLLRHAESATVDAAPGAPPSAEHRLGTLLVAIPVHHAPTLVEWDLAASRVLRAVQLPDAADAVRLVRVGPQLRVLVEAEHPALVTLDDQLRLVSRASLDLGPSPTGLTLAADARHVVIAATVGAARRVVVLEAGTLATRAQLDTVGPLDTFGTIRQDTLVLRGDRLFVVERDPARSGAPATLDRPAQPGALGLAELETASLRRIGFHAVAHEDPEARSALSAASGGVVLVNGDRLTTFDAQLQPTTLEVAALGPFVARGDGAALLRSPKASALFSVPADALEDWCLPVWVEPTAALVCSTMDETAGRTLSVLVQPEARLRLAP